MRERPFRNPESDWEAGPHPVLQDRGVRRRLQAAVDQGDLRVLLQYKKLASGSATFFRGQRADRNRKHAARTGGGRTRGRRGSPRGAGRSRWCTRGSTARCGANPHQNAFLTRPVDAIRAFECELDQLECRLRQHDDVLCITAILDAVEFLLARTLVHADQPVRTELEYTAAEERLAQAAFRQCSDGRRTDLTDSERPRWRPHPLAKKRIAVGRQRRTLLPHCPRSRRRLCARWVSAARPLCPAGGPRCRGGRVTAGTLPRRRIDSA